MITPLPFDSTLFGYPVGKCQVDESWNKTKLLEQATHYRVVYIFSKFQLELASKHFLLADIKLTFSKNLHGIHSTDPEICPYFGELTDQLLNLALESGVYSRFHTDPGFVGGEYEKLYQLWIEKALANKEVLLAENQAGFVSCSISGKLAQIGLIAVDKSQRGKGWGKKLVLAAEDFALQKGAQSMIIGTQQANIPASTLYQRLGYELVERIYIYHYRS
jgi:dTDP-4-amino-4,6-dideoxy-D-galactose acyltransferase